MPLQEYLDILTMAENYAKKRMNGFCYPKDLFTADMLASRIGISMTDFFQTYYIDLRDK